MTICSNVSTVSNSEALVERIYGAFLILITSFIGFFLAYASRGRWKSVIFVFRAFSAGVVLATSFMHVLADAVAALENPCLGLSRSFPWVFLIALYSTLLTFIFEHILEEYMVEILTKKLNQKRLMSAESQQDLADADAEKLEEDDKKKFELNHMKVVAYSLEAGIVFHSIFIGIGFGSNRKKSYIKTLTIAIIFHQAFEGVSLGTALARAQLKLPVMIIMGTIFSFVTPVGIFIGILLGNSYNANSKTSLAMEGVFNSISSGILIYNGIVDLILPTFDKHAEDGPKTKWLTYTGFVFMLIGSGLMSLIAKWA